MQRISIRVFLLLIVLTFAGVFGVGKCMADFDGDGKGDVFVLAGGQFLRYEATGDPGGLEFIAEATMSRTSAVGVGNFDNDVDGSLDLFVGRFNPPGKPGVYWWEPYPGNDMYIVNLKFAPNIQPNGIAVGQDPSGEGKLFLRQANQLTVYEKAKDNFPKSFLRGVTGGVQCIAAGDIDKQPGDEVLVGKKDRLEMFQFVDNALQRKQTLSGANYKALAIGNLDGDEYSDIITITTDGNSAGVMKWFEVTDGGKLSLQKIPLTIKNNSGFSCVAIGDIDGDGLTDILAGQESGPVRWFVCDWDNSVYERQVPAFGENAYGIAIAKASRYETWDKPSTKADVNKDGVVDSSDIAALFDDWGQSTMIDQAGSVEGVDAERIKVIESRTIVTEKQDLNFPQFRMTQDGVYAVGFGTGNHAATGWRFIKSADKGRTWKYINETTIPGCLSVLEQSDGHTVAMNYNTSATSDPKVWNAKVTHGTNNWSKVKAGNAKVTFPYAVKGFAFVRTMLESADGKKIYAVGHGSKIDGDTVAEQSMLLESSDNGYNWKLRSVVASQSEDWMGTAGPSETAIVRLRNGNLLAVLRTGATSLPRPDPPSECPMAYVISSDDGASWLRPVNTGYPGVFPDMAMLESGELIVLSGRPGVYVRLVSADGRKWSEPKYLYDGIGCANSSLQVDSDGSVVVIYTESDFCGHEHSGPENHIKMLRLQVDGPCGAKGYLPGDVNHDCNIDVRDIDMILHTQSN